MARGGIALGVAMSQEEYETLTVSGAFTANGNAIIGNAAADTLGFHGAAPVAQRASSAFPAAVTTAVINSSVSATCFGYTSAQATAILLLVNELRAAAVELGLIAT